jgi:hypothetical protein
LGHNASSCEERTPGTHVATALATLLDENKCARHDVRTVQYTLWNIYHILWAMLHRVHTEGWEVETEMCEIFIAESVAGTVRMRGPRRLPLLALLRLFNMTVMEISRRPQGGGIALIHDGPTRLACPDESFSRPFVRGVTDIFRGPDPTRKLPAFLMPPFVELENQATTTAAAPTMTTSPFRAMTPAAAMMPSFTATATATATGMATLPAMRTFSELLRCNVPVLDQVLADMDDDLRNDVVNIDDNSHREVATAWPSTMGSLFAFTQSSSWCSYGE